MVQRLSFLVCGIVCFGSFTGFALELDESPVGPGEWGIRPGPGAILAVNPPSFVWRPERGVVWEIQCAAEGESDRPVYQAQGLPWNVHCPAKPFSSGTYTWRYRGQDSQGRHTHWSQVRTFQVPSEARSMPMPPRAELMSRIPSRHPRLFLRPENLLHLRTLAQGPMQPGYQSLVKTCETDHAKTCRIRASPLCTRRPWCEVVTPGERCGGAIEPIPARP